jgi:hypothetical protein
LDVATDEKAIVDAIAALRGEASSLESYRIFVGSGSSPNIAASEGRQRHDFDKLYQDSPGSGISIQNNSGTSPNQCPSRLKNRIAQGA